MLLWGDKMARGGFVSKKQDIDGHPIWRNNVNPILNLRQYEVNFDDGEVTEITANFIVERMYSQCEENRNDMLLLDYFID